MNLTRNQMAAVFNEWATRYADNPDGFTDVLDDDGAPFDDYGECCAEQFERIAREMEGGGVMPPPIPGDA